MRRPLFPLSFTRRDALADVKAALDASIADPVVFRGRLLPRDRARALERHLLDVRKELASARELERRLIDHRRGLREGSAAA